MGQCPPKACALKVWVSGRGTLGGDGPFKRRSLVEEFGSLGCATEGDTGNLASSPLFAFCLHGVSSLLGHVLCHQPKAPGLSTHGQL